MPLWNAENAEVVLARGKRERQVILCAARVPKQNVPELSLTVCRRQARQALKLGVQINHVFGWMQFRYRYSEGNVI